MRVSQIFSILDEDEKEEMYKLLKQDHEKNIEEESKKGIPVVKIEDYNFGYYFISDDGSTTGYINTKVFKKDEVFDFFRRHKYSDSILIIPSENRKSLKYIIDIFKNMNFKIEHKSENNIVLKRKV